MIAKPARPLFCLVLLLFLLPSERAVGDSAGPGPRPVWNVRDFGSRGDGTGLDTGPINRAIVACNKAGGGTVFFPAGVYKTGTIRLLSNVTLYLDAGSVIKGSADMRDYPPFPYTDEERNTALIVAIGAHDISITGRGTIDGNADAFGLYDRPQGGPDFTASDTRQGEAYSRVNDLPDDGPVAYRERPGVLIVLIQCRGILVSDIKIVNAPNWCLHPACSRDIVLSRLDIRSSLLLPNADGIDASRCSNVRISDCNIEAGDDGIAFAVCADTYGRGICENNVVENCTISSRSAAIRIGYSAYDIRNLAFSNIVIHDSNRGIAVQARSTETIENISFSNIIVGTRLFKGKWWGKAEPILLSSAPGPGSSGRRGAIRNVRFTNMILEGQAGIVVAGAEDSEIREVSFDGILLALRDGPLVRSFGGNFDFRPAKDGHLDVFKHDIPALYASRVSGLAVRHLDVVRDGSLPGFFRDGLDIEDSDGVTVDGYRDSLLLAPGWDHGIPIRLVDDRNATIEDSDGRP
jgi:hypothetical protein